MRREVTSLSQLEANPFKFCGQWLSVLLAVMVLSSCAGPALKEGESAQGKASWYGERHHGKKTASGEPFNMNQMTAAHRTLPFGTWVRVRNLRNSKEVRVRINDRGPFAKDRIIDLSREAARQLDMIQSGEALVEMSVERR